MKKLEFETSKGTWIVYEMPNKIKNLAEWWDLLPEVSLDNFRKRIQLSKIKEKQASDIVDEPFGLGVGDNKILVFKDYEDEENTYLSSINSLHSLLKSKGIHLFENPYYHGTLKDYDLYKEAEEKTFYNPYIFKS